jgi:hypothetical protein
MHWCRWVGPRLATNTLCRMIFGWVAAMPKMSCFLITCGDVTGRYNFEEPDAIIFEKWGIGYIKYDYCMRTDRSPMLPAHDCVIYVVSKISIVKK